MQLLEMLLKKVGIGPKYEIHMGDKSDFGISFDGDFLVDVVDNYKEGSTDVYANLKSRTQEEFKRDLENIEIHTEEQLNVIKDYLEYNKQNLYFSEIGLYGSLLRYRNKVRKGANILRYFVLDKKNII